MKYVLIAMILQQQLTSISAPVAGGVSAEFDDLASCQKAAELVMQRAKSMRARDSFAECMPKANDTKEAAAAQRRSLDPQK